MNRAAFFLFFVLFLVIEIGVRAISPTIAFIAPVFWITCLSFTDAPHEYVGVFLGSAVVYDLLSPFTFGVITALLMCVFASSILLRRLVSFDHRNVLTVIAVSLLFVIEYVLLLTLPSTWDAIRSALPTQLIESVILLVVFHYSIIRFYVRKQDISY